MLINNDKIRKRKEKEENKTITINNQKSFEKKEKKKNIVQYIFMMENTKFIFRHLIFFPLLDILISLNSG